MKTHTSSYKENIKKFGRQLDSKIRYTLNGESIELGGEQLNSITPHYQSGILKSVMRQLDIDSNVEIPLETILTYEFGVKVGSEYEYINFGNYIVYSSEKQEDTNSWKIVCYDKMLYSMKNYEAMNITYPITIRNYINVICTHLGLTFKNVNDTFANYDKEIPNELYLDSEGRSLDYTFRDVLDQLAEVTASTICINEDDDELEIRYINNTNDTIDEEYLKDINVNFGEKFGPVNTIVLSRSAGADNIYYPSVLPENPCEIKISDNLIMNDNDRDTYMPDIYNQLNGLEYYINDFSSTGITYYNLCDRYNVQIGENTYPCIMFNDEVNITQGLEESVYTDFPEDGETDYKKADKTDRKINQTTLIVDKQNQQIQALITNVEENNEKIDALQPTEEVTGIEEMYLPKSAGKDLIEFKLKGKSIQSENPNPDYPQDIKSIGDDGNYIDVANKSKNQWLLPETETANGITFTKNSNGTFDITGTATANTSFKTWLPLNMFEDDTNYTLSSSYLVNGLEFRFEEYSTINGTWIKQYNLLSNNTTNPRTTKIEKSTGAYVRLAIYVVNGTTLNGTNVEVQLEKGTEQTTFAPYNILHNYINLTQPLPSLPDGTADELIVKDGQAKIIQNVGRIVLDGSEDWSNGTTSGYYRFYTAISNSISSSTRQLILSDYFSFLNNGHAEGIGFISNQNLFLYPNQTISTTNDFKTWLSTHNTLVYYVLAEPTEIDLGEVSIKTIDGNDYLYITDPIKSDMYAKYVRQTDYNDIYYTKHETDTQINIAKDSITSSVSETYETKLDASTSINNAKNEAISRANSYSDDILNTARTESTLYTNQKVSEEITATSERITVVEEAIRDGVSVVRTETGYTFDADGLKIAKEGQEMNSLLDNDGLSVKRNTDEVLTVRSEGVSAENITVRNYFKLDPVRFEKISSTTDSTQDGLGIFYTGGDN